MSKDEEISAKKDRIIGEAYAKLRTLERGGYEVKDQSADLKKWLESQDEVEQVLIYGDADITVKFKDKTQVGILLDRNRFYGSNSKNDEDLGRNPEYSPICIDDPHPVSKKAAVIDTLRDDWPPAATPDGIFNLLTSAGYNVDYIKSDNANLPFFTNFDDNEYGVVFIRSHGGIMNVDGNDKLHIMVRPFFASYPPDSGYNGIGVFTVYTDVLPQGYAYTYAFNDEFVRHYMNNKHFPNSLFHLLVCHGADPLANDDMIKSFLDRGVGCYTGWTKSASSFHGDPAAVQFFQVLCDASANPANNTAQAIAEINSAGHSPDPLTSAVLVAHGLNAMQIANCYIIKETSHIFIKDSSGKVIGKGFHDILDAVEYSTNQIIGGKYSKLQISHNIEIVKTKW
ncbi:MAG TPA: hypothetical protein PLK94_08955 [Alphaproteobacteria bacterium]|nr:hypothetical protein [Alphaproteobacteria bacterium]